MGYLSERVFRKTVVMRASYFGLPSRLLDPRSVESQRASAAWRFSGHLLKLRLRFSIPWNVEGVTPVKCAICGKAPHYGNVVSHANNTRRRRWNPNLRRVRAVVDGVRKQIRVCTGCIRLGRVKKAA